MKAQGTTKPVERLFPFVLRSRILLVGRETLRRSKSRLHFVLITNDISENSRAEVLKDFAHYPVVQLYTSEQLEQFFGVKGTKVLGFGKSGLAQSIYAEVKQFRLNTPARPVQRAELGGPGAAKAGQSASKDCEGGGSRSDGGIEAPRQPAA